MPRGHAQVFGADPAAELLKELALPECVGHRRGFQEVVDASLHIDFGLGGVALVVGVLEFAGNLCLGAFGLALAEAEALDFLGLVNQQVECLADFALGRHHVYAEFALGLDHVAYPGHSVDERRAGLLAQVVEPVADDSGYD